MPKVVLKKQAFVAMLLSSMEVYRKESFGVLLGKRKAKDFFVDNAVSFQSATRDYEYVSIDQKSERRMNSGLQFLSADEVIGDYHSHAEFPDRLSPHDKKELLESADKSMKNYVAILVVVKRTNSYLFWGQNSDKSISGSVGLKWLVRIRAFVVNDEGKITGVKIKCDYMKRLNNYLKHYKKSVKKLSSIEKSSKKARAERQKIVRSLKKYFA